MPLVLCSGGDGGLAAPEAAPALLGKDPCIQMQQLPPQGETRGRTSAPKRSLLPEGQRLSVETIK